MHPATLLWASGGEKEKHCPISSFLKTNTQRKTQATHLEIVKNEVGYRNAVDSLLQLDLSSSFHADAHLHFFFIERTYTYNEKTL